uniref:Cystatin domain-containing protein n=1 Tax=Minutocellus polymorphus TaxID=265543 RepID=A0A7S0AHZ9_9STRA|mmetsp:Transcript_1470/g.2442  ORF Transcript_1470/g.2442 Transcript_1470/m.2442 type:complete len:190 (+) Transcript_1470:109-678(+)
MIRQYFGLLSAVLALVLLQSPSTIAAHIDTQHLVTEPSHESKTTEVVPQHQRRNMVGGYADAAISEERVVDAAKFAVSALAQKQRLEEEEEGGGERTYTFNAAAAIRADEVNVVVLEAQKQVVAGMNYRLTIGLTDRTSGECLGGFKCIVYDRFGEMQVSLWGNQVECGEVGLIKAEAKRQDEEGDEEG